MASKKSKFTIKDRLANFMRLEVIIFLLIALIIFVVIVMKGQGFLFPRASGDVKLYLNAGSAELVTSKTVILSMDTLGKSVNFVNVTLKYDPAIMQMHTDGITTTDALKNVIIKSTSAEAANGTIRLTLAARPEDLGALPTGVVELARFQVTKNPSVTQSNLSSTMLFEAQNTQVVGSASQNLTMELPSLVFRVNPASSSSTTPAASTAAAPLATPVRTPTPTAAPLSRYQVRLTNIPNPDTAADFFEVDYVKIGSRIYQENDPLFTYSTKWANTTSTKYTVNTATVDFVSTEPTIILGTSKGPNRGTVQVYVNGTLKRTIVLTQSTSQLYEVSISLP